MQRVVAGQLRGRRLRALPTTVRDVRPSSSKVRGAVFDRLQHEVVGARVLDLCAGSGALAIEALSRGASHAVLVELNPAMVNYLRSQLAELALEAVTEVWTGDAARILQRGRPSSVAPFDLVLFDPPYAALTLYEQVLFALGEGEWLAPDAIVVVEWSPESRRGAARNGAARRPDPPDGVASSVAPTWGAGWVLDARREHGSTVLDFLHRDLSPPATPAPHLGETP